MRRSFRQRLVLAALALAAGASSNDPRRRSTSRAGERLLPWGLSTTQTSIPKQSKNFMDECESFVEFIERFRGGSSYGDFDPRQKQAYENQYGGNSYYGQKNDDDDDDYYGGGPLRDDDDGEDNYYYDDRGPRQSEKSPRYRESSSSFLDSLPAVFRTGDRRIGLSLVGAGSVVTMLGISLFFNKALLRLGNLLFISGVAMTMGLGRTVSYFMQPDRLRATACLGLGIFLVFIGSPVFGMILEVFGLLNLFGNMFPVILAVAKTMPGIGPLFDNMGTTSSRNSSSKKQNTRKSEYYDDGDYYDNFYKDDGRRSARAYDDGFGGSTGYDDGYGGSRGYDDDRDGYDDRYH